MLSPHPSLLERSEMPSSFLTQGWGSARCRPEVFVLTSLMANNSIYQNPSPFNWGWGRVGVCCRKTLVKRRKCGANNGRWGIERVVWRK